MKVAALRKVSRVGGVSWEDGQESAVRLWQQAQETGAHLLYQLNRHIRRHPWKAVGVALGGGMVLGALISHSGTRPR
jgi:ElaB/YqjD/DUF883 family membrane-anchored ribosome-binding protein